MCVCVGAVSFELTSNAMSLHKRCHLISYFGGNTIIITAKRNFVLIIVSLNPFFLFLCNRFSNSVIGYVFY